MGGDISLDLLSLLAFAGTVGSLSWSGTQQEFINISDNDFFGLYPAKISDETLTGLGIDSLNDLAYFVNTRLDDSSLTGGAKTGVVLQDVNVNGSNVTATDSGTLVRAPLESVLKSSMKALGVDLTIEEALSTQNGREILRDCINLLDNSFNSTNEQNLLTKIQNSAVALPLIDNKTYIPYNYINRLKDIVANSTIFSDDTFPAMTDGYNSIASSLSLEKTISMAATACRKAMTDAGRSIENISLYTRALLLAKTRLYNNMASKGMTYSECFFVAEVFSSSSTNWGVSVGAYQYTNENRIVYYSNTNDLVIPHWSDYVNVAGGSASVSYLSSGEISENVGDGSIADNARYKYGIGKGISDWLGTACSINGVSYNPVGYAYDGLSIPVTRDKTLVDTFPSWALEQVRSIGVVDVLNPAITGVGVAHLPLSLDVVGVGTIARPISLPQDDVQEGVTVPDVIGLTIPLTVVIPKDVVTVKDIAIELALPELPLFPTPVFPTLPEVEGAGGLITIYNPTRGELDSAGRELWTTNFLSQLTELFTNNPLDAVIGVQIVYSPVSSGNRQKITFGGYPTQVTSNVVTNQYSTIDCGTITLAERYGNVYDYEPYTEVSIFLPFIGIKKLNANDVIASSLHLTYKVDVYTGACLAIIEVIKKNVSCALYKFEGNCAVQIPITGASRSGLMSGILGIAGGFAMGGIAGGIIGGAMSTASGKFRSTVEHSGGFSGNVGAMDTKIPYVIITRSVPYEALSYNEQYGYPSNERILLKQAKGFTMVKDVLANTLSCTDSERNEIINLLKNGVIV